VNDHHLNKVRSVYHVQNKEEKDKEFAKLFEKVFFP
jgi:hypothetical protein